MHEHDPLEALEEAQTHEETHEEDQEEALESDPNQRAALSRYIGTLPQAANRVMNAFGACGVPIGEVLKDKVKAFTKTQSDGFTLHLTEPVTVQTGRQTLTFDTEVSGILGDDRITELKGVRGTVEGLGGTARGAISSLVMRDDEVLARTDSAEAPSIRYGLSTFRLAAL